MADDYQKDAEALQNTPMKGDGYYALPDQNITLHESTLAKLTEEGKLIKRSKEELNYPDDPLFSRAQNGQEVPVYQVNFAGVNGKQPSDNFAAVAPEAHLMKTAEGQEYILVNEGYQKLSSEAVRAKMISDRKVDEHLASGDFQKAETLEAELKNNPDALKRFEEFKNHLTEEASVTGHKNATFIAEQSSDIAGQMTPAGQHTAFAVVSKEGSEYIVVNRELLGAALQSEKKDEKMAVLMADADHEVTHLDRGDVTSKGLARDHNNLAVARYEEIQSDLYGAVRSHHPEGMRKQFEEELQKAPSGTQELPDHPALKDRIEVQKLAGAAMQEYEKTNTVLNAADREAEARYVVPKVMGQMEGKWQLPMQSPDAPEKNSPEKTSPTPKEGGHEKSGPQAEAGGMANPPHGLSDSQMKDILAVRNLMGGAGSIKMQDAETIAKDHSAPGKQPSQTSIAIRS